jgi:hypothetical protein
MAWTEITRPKYRREGMRYASDRTDEEWAVIEHYLPPVRLQVQPSAALAGADFACVHYSHRLTCPAHPTVGLKTPQSGFFTDDFRLGDEGIQLIIATPATNIT